MADAGTVVGRYVLDRPLGRGGMGEVYLAFSPAGDPVAVKLVRSDRLDPLTRQRCEAEAEIARSVIGTSRVARFLDADPYSQQPWLAMEYVPGPTLAAHIADQGPLSETQLLSLGALLAEGLHAVHAVGLLHRDVKPQNVILGSYGPTLVDFGLGALLGAQRADERGMAVGTIRYMPPEQVDITGPITPAADVYGLGATLAFAATARPPYDGDTWDLVATRVQDPATQPDLGGIASGTANFVASMLAHTPGERPTLTDVTASCSRRLDELGTTPTRARHDLVEHTALVKPGLPVPRMPSEAATAPPVKAEPARTPARHRDIARRVADELRGRYAAASTL